MASSGKSFYSSNLQPKTARKSSKPDSEAVKSEETGSRQGLDCRIKREPPVKKDVKTNLSDVNMEIKQQKEIKMKADQSQINMSVSEKELKLSADKDKLNVSEASSIKSSSILTFECTGPITDPTAKDFMLKKPLAKFTLSVESEEDTAPSKDQKADSSPDLTPQLARSSFGRRISDISRESSTLSGLKLNLSGGESVSSPECGSSPEIRSTSGRIRMSSGDISVTSTPVRTRKQAFCGISYLARRNFSRENTVDDTEDTYSASSTDYPPGSIFSNFGADRFRVSDELNDEACNDGRLRESTDSNDDSEARVLSEHSLTAPVNKQLRIVTSVDRALNPHRRSSVTSLKVLNLSRSSSENLEHLAFVDYLKRLKLGQYLKNFPPNMTLLDFK